MNREEAERELLQALQPLRVESYQTLAGRIGTAATLLERRGASGTRYQITVECLWDAAPGGAVRVVGAIDDGGWRAWMPLCEDFLAWPGDVPAERG